MLFLNLGAIGVLGILIYFRTRPKSAGTDANTENRMNNGFEQINRNVRESIETLGRKVDDASLKGRSEQSTNSTNLRTEIELKLATNAKTLTEFFGGAAKQLTDTMGISSQATLKQLTDVRATLETQLKDLNEKNQIKLDEMRGVVDKQLNETLQTRLGEAFKQVSERLEEVHKGLGQVQTLSSGVASLNRTLAGVKTRGVFGEVMLNNLLEEFLHPQQMERNFKPDPHTGDTVEFAIKLPGRGEKDHEDPVWLPIDAKFPKESFERLIACSDLGDSDGVISERKELLKNVTGFAKDIRDKYIRPSRTTNFAILYLPLESLFAEVVREPGFLEKLQRDYKVTLASPTTLGAYLNALSMGFQTLAVQRQSAEIQKLLGAVRTQFQKFGTALANVEKKIEESRLALAPTVERTRMMEKKLRKIDVLPELEMNTLLPPGTGLEITDVDEDEDAP